MDELLKMEHRPWPEFGRDGKGMTLTRLAGQLKPFGIQPQTQRVAATHPLQIGSTAPAKVYSVAELRAIFRRYS